MKRLFLISGITLILVIGMAYEAKAADVQAQLADIDGTSAFSVLSSTPAEVAYIDSAGNASFNGDLTVGDEAVVKGGMRLDADGTQNTTAETLIVDSKVGIGSTTLTSSLNVGTAAQFQVGSDGDLDSIKNVAYSWPTDDGAANQFLQSNGSGTLSWAPALAASTCTATETVVQTTAGIAVTGLSFSLAANTNYTFEFFVVFQAASTAVGLRLDLTSDQTPTYVAWQRMVPRSSVNTTAVGCFQFTHRSAFGTTAAGDVATNQSQACTPGVATLRGVVSNGASAATMQVIVASEAASSMSVLAGSWGVLYPQ